MRRPLISFLLIILILVALPFGVWGEVTATYVPENPIYFTQSPGVFTHPTIIGAKLGTLTMFSNGPIYNPGFMTVGDMARGVQMQLYHKDWEEGTFYWRTFPFYVVSVAYPYGRGGTPVITTPYDNVWPIWKIEGGVTINVSPFFVDLYLINNNTDYSTNPAGFTGTYPIGTLVKPNSPIVFVNPFNPYFTVGVGKSEDDKVNDYATGPGGSLAPDTNNPYNPPKGSYVAIDGVSGPDSTALIDTGGFTSSEGGDSGFMYVEEVPTVPLNFVFSFQNDTVNFDLSEAYYNKKTINVAQMDVQNGEAGTTYTQNLTFTDSGSALSFQLKADDMSGNTISYNLYFGDSPNPIPYGQFIEWTGLVPNMNYKDLKIGGILESEVNQRVSGSYSDTITVTITAVP